MARVLGRRSVFVVLAVGALLGLELWPRDDRHITSLLNELCAKLNRTRDATTLAELQAALRAVVTPQVVVLAPEAGVDSSGPDALSERARALLAGPPLSFTLTDVEVKVSGALARVTANLIVTVSGSGEQQRDLRLTEVRLRKIAGEWQIEHVSVDPVRPAEPEARP